MKKFSILILLTTALLFGEKNAYIVTGPESSGSMFITRHIAKILDCDAIYGNNVGKQLTANTVVIHISQPFREQNNYLTLSDFKKWLPDYKLHFILTTRDQNIVKRSKKGRFPKREQYFDLDCETSRAILAEIMENERFIIWNYETMIYLRGVYFKQLNKFIGLDSNEFPDNLYDGNKKHLKI